MGPDRKAGRSSSRRARVIAAALVCSLAPALLSATPSSAAPPPLYHSPADDGASGGTPFVIPAGQPVTLHLYLGVGASASTADPCHQGDGDEVCGYRLRLVGSGIDLQSFTPAEPDLLYNLSSGQLDLTGGDFQTGELGPTKLGDLLIEGPSEGGTLDLALGQFVSTQLTREDSIVPQTLVLLPEPGTAMGLAAGAALLLLLRRRRFPCEEAIP